MSAGELTCEIDRPAMDEVVLAIVRWRREREASIPMEQDLAELYERLRLLPPSPQTPLCALMDVFKAGQQPTTDWLERFARALA